MSKQLSWLAAILIVDAGLAALPARGQSTVRWNVVEMGAVADGATDNTAAFQKALDAAGKAGGGIVEAPAGRYRINGTLSVPQGVTLQGTYRVPPTRTNMQQKPDGTILQAYAGRGSEQGPPSSALRARTPPSPAWSSSIPSGSSPTCRRCPIRPASNRTTPTTWASRNVAF